MSKEEKEDGYFPVFSMNFGCVLAKYEATKGGT